MPDQDRVAGGPIGSADRLIDDVEEFANRDRRRARRVGPLVITGVGDDQPVGRREQGVEQQLSVLHSRIPLAQLGVEKGEVITVSGGVARKGSVIQAEQTDDPMRHRAHRHQGADGEVACPEIGPSWTTLKAISQQRSELRQTQLGCGVALGLGLPNDVVEKAPELGPLPVFPGQRRGQSIGHLTDGIRPAFD